MFVVYSIPTSAASSSPSIPAGLGGLTVSSEPAGADVYLDGKLAGETPFTSTSVAPGDHRVKVVKAGYLENARIVSVAAGRAIDVAVKLTADDGAGLQTPKPAQSSGGSSKWLWIAIAGGGGAAAAILLLKSGNKPPDPGTVAVTPSGTGIAAATTFTFTSQGATDTDKDPLTFSWDFGDGTTATGSPASHTFSAAGTFTVKLTVSDGKNNVAAPTVSVTTQSLAGTWNGTLSLSAWTANITQSGNLLGGTFTSPNISCQAQTGPTGSISGNVSAGNFISMIITLPGCLPVSMGGTINGTNSMSGTMTTNGFGTFTWSLSR